ncbi:aldehyde dehydrogenase family protein [Dietzia maris]
MPEPLPPAACFIGGEHLVADGPLRDIINPFTEQPMGSLTEAGAQLVDRAVHSAAGAHAVWRETPVSDRAQLLELVADQLEHQGDQLAALVTRQMGMPITLARVTQAQLPARVLRATAALARTDFPWQEEADGAILHRYGAGVVGAITPWNMPVHQIIAKISAAVAAGCSVVLKASEQTPYDALRIAEIFHEAGGPDGLINVVTGTGPATGAALAAHPALSRLSFTGSVRAGKAVAGLAAASLTKCSLELGGKSPALVLPDADLTVAIPSALTSGLVNSGQACNATTRMLVPADRMDDVVDLLQDAAAQFSLGDPMDETTTHGPLVTEVQKTAVLAHIRRAVDQGGRLITGSDTGPATRERGYFVDPTVIVDLPENADAVRDEIFGPVVVVQPYRDVEDAVRIANDSDYGLSAEVWSGSVDHAHAVAARLSVGQVKINGVRTRNRPMVPFGGVRNSGYGRELGTLGIEEFVDVRAVMA